MNLSELTVIVPTRNEEKNIPRFLASVPEAVELIVVDASDDRTVEILKRERRGGKDPALTSARQLGADSARTAWLLFSDADIEFPPEYIFLRLLGHEDDNIVYGPKLSRDFYIIFAKLPLGNVKTGVFSLLSNANPLDDWKNATR